MLPLCTKDRKIVYVEQVYTSSTFYIKSAVHGRSLLGNRPIEFYLFLETYVRKLNLFAIDVLPLVLGDKI